MLVSILRSAAVPVLLAAFPALSAAQMSIGATSVSNLLELGQVTPAPSPLPVTETYGLVLGSWVDPSTASLGSMLATLYDSGGQFEYDLVATVSEYIAAAGSGQRFGGISGYLYGGIAPTGILVSGTWVIDLATNTGTFKLDIYMGGFSPTAPLLSLGSMKGRLSKPQLSPSGQEEKLASGIPVASQPGNFGSPSEFGEPAGGGGGGVSSELQAVRSVRGRWTMF